MYSKNQVEKPKKRSQIRQLAGKEYFCFKQHIKWFSGKEKWSQKRSDDSLPFIVKEHKSFLLRPLKDVDMHLQHNKVTNLRLALERINGVLIEPGETFSFWKMVGRPTRHKGYLTGMTLSNGEVKQGVGGGLCQMGNLIYWMTIHTPLTISKRWRHSYDVFPDVNRKIPFGSGATLSYNYIDLCIKNTTNSTFQINLWLDDTHLNGTIASANKPLVSYEVIERNHLFKQQWWGGYTRHNEIWRLITDMDNNVKEELVTENHAIMMYNPLLE